MTTAADPGETATLRDRFEVGVRDLNPGYFALVMGTGIVSAGVRTAGVTWLAASLLWIAVACYVVLVAMTIWRLLKYRAEIVDDLGNPARAFGFFTFVAATNVVGAGLVEEQMAMISGVMLAVAALTWLLLGYLIPALIIHRKHERSALSGANGTWFIWVVASQSLAMLAATLEPLIDVGRREFALVAVFSWSVGVFLYGAVGCLVVVRLFRYRVSPKDLTPPYWVSMGATAITVVAGSKIVEMADAPMIDAVRALVAGLAVFFWAFGTWLIPALIAGGWWRHVHHRMPLTYESGMWSIVFPLGMYGVGSAYLGYVDNLPIVAWIGHIQIWIALAVWAVVFVAMLIHLARYALGWRDSSVSVALSRRVTPRTR